MSAVAATGTGVRRLVCALAALLATGCGNPPPPELPVSVLSVPAECDPEQGCPGSAAGLSLQVRFETPAQALQPFPVSARIVSDEPVETVMVTFSMRGMDMGLNRYRLESDAQGVWQGRVTLPICVSGRSDWIAAFELTTATRRYRAQVPFVLRK